MKKVVFIILIVILIIVITIAVKISSNNSKESVILKYNAEFEQYKEKTLYGVDVVTIINKAIDNNTNYKVEKDEDGYYIENNEYSTKVELILLSKGIDEKPHEVKYPMETLQRTGLDGFVASFSLTSFECTNIEYNENGRVSKIVLKQLEM